MKFQELIIGLLVFSVTLSSCGAKKKVVTKKTKSDTKVVTERPPDDAVFTSEVEEVVEESKPVVTEGMSSTEAYIANYSDIAQDEMRKYGIPASITLAQGILESGSAMQLKNVSENIIMLNILTEIIRYF